MGLRQKFRNFHVVLSRPPFLAAIRKATLCGVRPASTMVPAEAELESRSPGWRNSAYQWAAHICGFVVHRKIAKGLTPWRGFARTSSPKIHSPDACSCSGAGVERRFVSSAMTARDTGWRRSGFPKEGLYGGRKRPRRPNRWRSYEVQLLMRRRMRRDQLDECRLDGLPAAGWSFAEPFLQSH